MIRAYDSIGFSQEISHRVFHLEILHWQSWDSNNMAYV